MIFLFVVTVGLCLGIDGLMCCVLCGHIDFDEKKKDKKMKVNLATQTLILSLTYLWMDTNAEIR